MAEGSSILSAGVQEKLKSIEQPVASDYLSGKSSSTFAGATEDASNEIENTKQSASNAIAGATGAASAALDTVAISTEVVAEATMYITTQVASKLAEVTSAILSTSFLADIPGRIAYHTKANLIDMSEILEMAGPQDKVIEKKQKKAEQKSQSEFISKISDTAAKVKSTVDKVNNTVGDKLNSLTSYITAGPAWVEKQVSKISDNVVNGLDKSLGETSQNIIKKKQDWVESFSEKQGKQAAEITNQLAIKAQKSIIQKINIELEKLKAKAFALAQTLIMKLLALLGVG